MRFIQNLSTQKPEERIVSSASARSRVAIVTATSADPAVPDETAKRRRIDVHDPTLSDDERRQRLLELQRQEYAERRVADTRVAQLDPKYVEHFRPFWEPLYDRLMVGTRRRLCDSSLSDAELAWLRRETRYDYCYFVWNLKYTQYDECPRRPRCVPTERNDVTQFFDTPNAQFYEQRHTACYCLTENTLVLCNDLSHQHSKNGWQTQIAETHRDPTQLPAHFSFQRSIESIDRYRDRLLFGAYNQNIVAAGVFGAGTQQRWDAMLEVCAALPEIHHSASLYNRLDALLAEDANLSELRHCIWTFSYSSSRRREHPGDRAMSLPPKTIYYLKSRASKSEYCEPRTVADAGYLDAGHPVHWRFDAREAQETTLALALFVEATKNSNWLNVWNHWFRLVQTHCAECLECKRAFVEFLGCILLLEQTTLDVFTLDFRVRLERLLFALRLN